MKIENLHCTGVWECKGGKTGEKTPSWSLPFRKENKIIIEQIINNQTLFKF